MTGIQTWKNEQNAFHVLRLHYSADKDKGADWIASAKKGIPSTAQWEREYEISFETYAGKPVYGDFDRTTHASMALHWNYHREMIRGWDFGFHHPCVVFCQMNDLDQLFVFEAIMGTDILIHSFAEQILKHSREKYPNSTWRDYCDPAGKQRSDKIPESSIQVLRSKGIRPSYREQEARAIDYGLQLIRFHLQRRTADKQPGILVNNQAQLVIEMFQGGYHYPEAKDGKPESEVPEKDGYYDNVADALRYLCVNVLPPIEEAGKQRLPPLNMYQHYMEKIYERVKNPEHGKTVIA